jgi:anti-sigma B factor antagonist
MTNMDQVAINESNIQLPFLPQIERKSKLKLSTEIEVHEDVTVVHCHGRIVFREEAVALWHAVDDLMPHAHQVVLNLHEVEAIDGAGLGRLLAIQQRVAGHGGSLRLASPSRRTLDLLQLTNLDTVFEIYPALEDALLVSHWQIA